MSISQRNDGRWIVKFKDREGRWKQRSFCSRAEAEAFEADCRYDKEENSHITVLEAVLVFLKNIPHSQRSKGSYEFCVAGHDRKDGTHSPGPAEAIASKYVDSLNRRDLETVRDAGRKAGMANSTINLYVAQLNAAFNWCAGQDLVPENPWGKYRALPARHGSRQGRPEDFQRIYACLPLWMQWACRTAMALCLRPGMRELFSLRWKAFSWGARSVTVWMGKTSRAKTVYPPAQYLEEARLRFLGDGEDVEKLVCRSFRDRPVTDSNYAATWRRACTRAGVAMPMYAIRHIAASQMLAAGADLAAVAAQLGHRDLTTTGRYYAHALPSAQRKAGEALGCTSFGADWCGKTDKS